MALRFLDAFQICFYRIRTLVYATDFEEEDVYAIRKLTELARAFSAEIKVVHIVTEDEYEGETQMNWFKEMLEEKVTYGRVPLLSFREGNHQLFYFSAVL